MISLMNQKFIEDLGTSVLRGQEGVALAGMCVGDCRFGYKSIPVPGTETTRRGSTTRPKMMYAIDETTNPKTNNRVNCLQTIATKGFESALRIGEGALGL